MGCFLCFSINIGQSPLLDTQQEERSDIRQTQREIQQIIGRSEAKNCRKTEDTLREMKISK